MRGAQESSPAAPNRAGACPNCGAATSGAFCARCGQASAPRDFSLGGFLRDTTHELTQWDGKIPSTLRTLFLRPGLLTVDFLAGRRARWLTPLRVYLICSVAFFAGRPLVTAVTGRSPRPFAEVTLSDRGDRRTLTAEERQRIAEGLPGRLIGVDRLERAAADSRRLSDEIAASFSKAMFVLLPIFALLTWLAWRSKRWPYPKHLYVALHLHAALFGALTIVSLALFIPSDVVARLLVVPLVAYLSWHGVAALHRVFGESWPRTIVKTVSVGLAYFICLLAVGMLLLGYAVTRM